MANPFANPTATAARPMLLQIEDQYNKRIDDDVAKLVDCFADIVKVGEVRSSESLLSLITELKQHLLLNDTNTLSRLMEKRSEELTRQKDEIKDTLIGMRNELASTIYDLESVYYRSLTGP
ncbi:uncharacterized protein BYT42DRAFT_593628 [Radiomyces spectabilis]|uniref:uncharacterized protein n=1 Tax=Radiomyces spectabilis TaxID=64574 RepID=UPI002220D1C1|nr:uncharacterized protein BYT42DRAFT_593628 [Radiomyces spectabilis]KAI8379606.1 hypothetical protein BYT42DRAFT_593628 [Radiomyces spectabilis]